MLVTELTHEPIPNPSADHIYLVTVQYGNFIHVRYSGNIWRDAYLAYDRLVASPPRKRHRGETKRVIKLWNLHSKAKDK